jgi:hypothetical protein
MGVSCLGYNWVDHKKEWRKEAIQAQELKRTQVTLSLVTIDWEWSLDLGEDLISSVCLVLNAIALVRCRKSENLDTMNSGWLGVFIAPTTKLAVWWRLLSHGAPYTVRCACHVTQPLDSDRWSFCLLGHRTGVTPWFWGYKIFFYLLSKFRCYLFFSFLFLFCFLLNGELTWNL